MRWPATLPHIGCRHWLLVSILSCASVVAACSSPSTPPNATLRQAYLLTQFDASPVPFVMQGETINGTVHCDIILASQRLDFTGSAAVRQVTSRPHVCSNPAYDRMEVDTLSGAFTVQGRDVQITLVPVPVGLVPSTVFARLAGDSLVAYREDYASSPPLS